MKRASKGLLLAALVSCGSPNGERIYSYNDLRLVTGYTAIEACSCLFVAEQPEDFCRAWVKASPPLGRFTIDNRNKVVVASAAVLWGATARYVDDVVGCQLE
jgi:hypothetical protein